MFCYFIIQSLLSLMNLIFHHPLKLIWKFSLYFYHSLLLYLFGKTHKISCNHLQILIWLIIHCKPLLIFNFLGGFYLHWNYAFECQILQDYSLEYLITELIFLYLKNLSRELFFCLKCLIQLKICCQIALFG